MFGHPVPVPPTANLNLRPRYGRPEVLPVVPDRGRVLDLWIGDNRRKSNRESETYGSRISFVPRLSEY